MHVKLIDVGSLVVVPWCRWLWGECVAGEGRREEVAAEDQGALHALLCAVWWRLEGTAEKVRS